MRRVLGVDPGLRSSAYCLVPNIRSEPTAQDWICVTIRRRDELLDTYMRHVAERIRWVAVKDDVELVAIEGFEHRGWLTRKDGAPRRVQTAPDMGRLIGRLEGVLGAADVPYVLVSARDSKAGMETARTWFRDSHQWSAWCAAIYGGSAAAMGRKR